MSDYSHAFDGQAATVVAFRISEPPALALSKLQSNLEDLVTLAGFMTLLNISEYHYWPRSSQREPQIIRMHYGSPFEVLAQLPDVANALAPHMVWPTVGAGVLLANQVLKQVRLTFRDWTGGWREVSEGMKFRAEADQARAEAEESRARSARERAELENRRRREIDNMSDDEALAALAVPDFLRAAAEGLPPQARQNLLDMLENLDKQDRNAVNWRSSSVPVRSAPTKEKQIVHMFSRLVLKEDASIERDEGPRP